MKKHHLPVNAPLNECLVSKVYKRFYFLYINIKLKATDKVFINIFSFCILNIYTRLLLHKNKFNLNNILKAYLQSIYNFFFFFSMSTYATTTICSIYLHTYYQFYCGKQTEKLN